MLCLWLLLHPVMQEAKVAHEGGFLPKTALSRKPCVCMSSSWHRRSNKVSRRDSDLDVKLVRLINWRCRGINNKRMTIENAMTLKLGRLFRRAEILSIRAGPKICCYLIDIFLLLPVNTRSAKEKCSLVNKMQASLITRFPHLLEKYIFVQGSKTPDRLLCYDCLSIWWWFPKLLKKNWTNTVKLIDSLN